MMGGMGSVAAAVFGVIWIIAAVRMGAPGAFPLFGFVFIAIAVGQAVYHFRNAKGKNRYSVLDIVDSREERGSIGATAGVRRPTRACVPREPGGCGTVLPLLWDAGRGRFCLL